MKSKSSLYELLLSPINNCKLSKIPKGATLEKALPNCICSDLFVYGFSYKPLTLPSNTIARNDTEYQLLKRIKKARFIRDDLRLLSTEALLEKLVAGFVCINEGYIGHKAEVSNAVKPVRLIGSDQLFGVELRRGSLFRCFAKTENPVFMQEINIDGCQMKIQSVRPIEENFPQKNVLQADLPIDKNPHIQSDSPSHFKLSYDRNHNCMIVCAGSVISSADYFGTGIFI